MRAAMIQEPGAAPRIVEIDEPTHREAALVMDVTVAAIGPTDLMKATGNSRPYPGPHVVNGEGVGRRPDGKRAYFGHSILPYGACAERTLVAEEEVWEIPENVSDEQAAAIGISGTGALIALEQADITANDDVLVLGATGVLGQIALQIIRTMGARRVVAAGRNSETLQSLTIAGLADETATIGQGDDLAALRNVSGSGFDMILDIVFGPPAEAALKTLKMGGRMMSVGRLAGLTINLPLEDIGYRSLHGVGTGIRPAPERRSAFQRLMALAASNRLQVKTIEFALEDIALAWDALSRSANAKVIVRP